MSQPQSQNNTSPRIFAFIPIRHESQRLPGKNFRLLGDRPLYYYIIDTLLSIKEISAVIIDTNSPIIKEGIKIWQESQRNSRRIIVVDRDPNLTGPQVSTNTLIQSLFERDLHRSDLSFSDNDIFLQTHVTNPFLKRETIYDAITKYLHSTSGNKPRYDSLFSVNKRYYRLYDNRYKPINHDTNNLIQTQDLPPIYEDNSCFYLFTKRSFYENNCNRLGKIPYFYVMEGRSSSEEVVDIDWEEDFELAKAFLQMRKNKDLLGLSDSSGEERQKIVLITGVSGGIGWETAKLFKDQGWKVIGTDLIERTGDNGNIDKNTPYHKFITADLRLISSVQLLYDEFLETEVCLDALINVAAIQDCQHINEVEEQKWDMLMNCNLKIPFFLCQKFSSLLRGTSYNKDKGCIVNVASIHALQSSENISTYAISKAALSGMTRTLAIELGKYDIRVNSVSPGAVDTPMLRAGMQRGNKNGKNIEELLGNLANKHLLGKIGKPEDIANAIYFLADWNRSGYMTGSNLIVDGGATIKLSTE